MEVKTPMSSTILKALLQGILVCTALSSHAVNLPATGSIEVAFSPKQGAEELVIRVIDSAQSEIKMLAYSFTSSPVVAALLRAQKRGVKVSLVADKKSNTEEDRSGKARAALATLVNAGCDVRVIGAYATHHDKVIVVDRKTVELGSFNYSAAAANYNSENVLVNWDNQSLALVYLAHFERNHGLSEPYAGKY
jgi:phosphatidylserine/phosphatidylglycerophosphate/cardiolipin synthase-like enzyme